MSRSPRYVVCDSRAERRMVRKNLYTSPAAKVTGKPVMLATADRVGINRERLRAAAHALQNVLRERRDVWFIRTHVPLPPPSSRAGMRRLRPSVA